MNAPWPPNTKHRGRRVRRGVAVSFMVFLGGCVAVNWVGDRLPSDVNVGSNIGPTPCDVTLAGQCARHLTTTTRPTTTTKPPTTTVAQQPVYGPERPCNPGGTDILVVTDGRSYCVIRTASSAQLAWALTRLGN